MTGHAVEGAGSSPHEPLRTDPQAQSWRPTWALHRAVLVGLTAVTVGVLTRRPDVLLLGLPLLAVAAWTVASRPPGPVRIAVDVGPRVLREGCSGAVTVQLHPHGGPARRGMELTAALPLHEDIRLQPLRGCVAVLASSAPGREATVGFTATRYGERPLGPLLVTASAAWAGYRATWRDVQVGTVLALPVVEVSKPCGGSPASARAAGGGSRLMLLLDATTDVGDHAEALGSSLDRGVRAAAALAEYGLRRGDEVGLSVLTSSGLYDVPARSGPRQAQQVDDALARTSSYRAGQAAATRSFTSVDRSGGWEAAARRTAATPKNTVVVALTPLLSERVRTHLSDMAKARAFLIVDTLPGSLRAERRALSQGGWAHRDEVGRPDALFAAAWRIRLLERDDALRDLRGVAGVSVVAWRGPAGHDAVLAEVDRYERFGGAQ